MTKSDVSRLLNILDEHYPREACYLTYEQPWQLLVATILSAQCTDARVNMVTPVLFSKYPNMQLLAEAAVPDVAEIIKSTGLFNGKAQNIVNCMKIIVNDFNGEIPVDINILTTFPGVGRKTGNLVLGHIYNIPGIVVDTHVIRVSTHLGLTIAKDPVKIEKDLMLALPKEHWIRFNTQIIAHGRAVCTARSPKCGKCKLSGLCLKNASE